MTSPHAAASAIETATAVMLEGNLPQAQRQVDELLAREPDHAPAWHLKGVILKKQGDRAAAVNCFNRALQCRPDFAEACFDLALTLEEANQLPLAVKIYEHLLKIAPAHKGAGRLVALRGGQAATQMLEQCFLQGNTLLEQGQLEAAMHAYRQALAVRPDVPEVLANLGVVLHRLWRLAEAERVFQECLALRPGYAPALNNLGNMYKDMPDARKAEAAYRQAVAAAPDLLDAWVNLGKILQKKEDHAGAAEAYAHALRINPQHAEALAEMLLRHYTLCRWEGIEGVTARMEQAVTDGQQSAVPFVVALYGTPATQFANARHWAKRHFPAGQSYSAQRPMPAAARKDGKLRIGYVSADFHRNATAFLISEMFERHDRSTFEIYAYSCGADDGSPERQRIMQAVDYFRDIRLAGDRDAAAQVRQDGIDLLVDLKGYTIRHRLGLFALRPAPVQIHYLGYPGTTGANFMDYFIADAVAAPAQADGVFSENLIRLPHSYQINDRSRPLPEEGKTRAEYGLPEEAFVFCAFNQAYKITPQVFDVWMRLLAAVEGSVLWLYENVAEASANLRKEAEKCGIAPERLIFAPMAPLGEHLARYRQVDLFLDTFPVCGHTTASDALWCGVPVVAMQGESFASRVAASLLQAVGMSELVTADLAAYESLALALACDPKRLQSLKRHLASQRMELPLFDAALTTRAIEAAYREAARRHEKGMAPAAFSVSETLDIS
jgi:protein O-GlcNAc transferase